MHRLLFICLVSSLALGCGADEPGAGNTIGPDAGDSVTPDPKDDGIVPLSVGLLTPETPWFSIPVVGKGPPGGIVVIEGGTDTVTPEVQSDGSFCADVPLAKGVNSLSIVARDVKGERSEVVTKEVVSLGDPLKPGDPVSPTNAVLGGFTQSNQTVEEEEGSFDFLTDGDYSTFVKLQNSVLFEDYLILRLPDLSTVNKIRVVSSPDCAIGDYLVHTTDEPPQNYDLSSPSESNEDKGPWTFRGRAGQPSNAFNVSECSVTANLECHEFTFDPSKINTIALRFLEDPCSNVAYLGERDIFEIEAWSPEGPAPTDIVAPSCRGGQ